MNKIKVYEKNEFLKLYRNLLRCHRVLQEPMKSMGDQYVKNEWRLHKKVDTKVASIFYQQWDQYLNILMTQRESILDQALEQSTKDNNTTTTENNENKTKTNIGINLNEKQLKSLNKKQLEQLDKLKSETTTVYKPSDE